MKCSIMLLLFFVGAVIVNGRQIFKRIVLFESMDTPNTVITAANSDTTDVVHYIERGKRAEERINLSYPGTKWCGPGSTADNYDQLGEYSETDKCCRAHDHCDNIPSGETKYGLKNDDLFTRLHCKCDQEFKKCLKSSNDEIATKIGFTYFSVRDLCYMNEHPIKECAKYETRFFLRRCVEYILDATQPKQYQWFELPFYGSQDDAFGRCRK